MRPGLNVRFLAGLLATAFVLAGGVHWLHAYQVERNAAALLHRADRAREQGRLDLSAKYLQRYLGFRRDDTEVMGRLALTLEESATTRGGRLRALLAFERVLRQAADRQDLRRRLVKLALDVQRPTDALAHLEVLLEAAPDDGELHYLQGRCEETLGNDARAADAFKKAIQSQPNQLETYLRLANLLRQRLQRTDKADQVMDEMVRRNDSSEAYRLRARHHRELRRLDQAESDLAAARKKSPDHAEVLLASAELALHRGEKARCRELLRSAGEKHPADWRMYQALAELELAEEKPQEAITQLRRGLRALPGQADLLAALAELLLEHEPGNEAQEIIARLRKQNYAAAALDYLEARSRLAKEQWREAARLLERAGPQLGSMPALRRQADLSLSRCYAQLGDADRQLAVCRRAVAADPGWLPARIELAGILLATGKIDQALVEYRQIVSLPGAPASAGVTLGQLLVLQNQRLSPPKRDWREVERLLQAMEKAAPDSVAVVLVHAEILAAQGHPDRAQQLLERACRRHSKEAAPWLALADLAERNGGPPGPQNVAQRTLDEAEKQLGDSVPLRLARLKSAMRSSSRAAAEELERLGRNLGSFSKDGQAQLGWALADAYRRRGDHAEALRLLAEVARCKPGDLRARVALFELCLESDNDDEAQRRLREIQAIEGEAGPLGLGCEALRLIRLAQQGNRKGMARARELIGQAKVQRPGLPILLLCEAQIDELEGNVEHALECYRQVVDRDEGNAAALGRWLRLLRQTGRHADAEHVLAKLQKQSLGDRDAGRLAAEIMLRNGNRARAVELARQVVAQAVAAGPKGHEDHLWLGELLALAGETAEAEQALRRAAEIGPAAAEPRVALVAHLVRIGKADEAARAFADARTVLAEHPLALAECFEALKEPDEAGKHYEAALLKQPDDAGVLQRVAGFYLRLNQPQKATPILHRLMKGDSLAWAEQRAWARRNLAMLTAANGGRRAVQEALALVAQNGRANALPPEDRRVQARLLAALKDRASRLEAIKQLEELKARQTATADDLFALAGLHEANRDWPRARIQLRELVSVANPNAVHVAHYARLLLKHAEADEARLWLNRLEQLDPNGLPTLEIQVRLLSANGKGEKAVRALEEAIVKEGEGRAPPAFAAALAEELNQLAVAERFYRLQVEQRAEDVLVLVGFLGRHGRADEGLELCESAWQRCPAASVAAAGVALLRAGAAKERQREVESRIEEALRGDPQSPGLLVQLADLRDLQGRWEEAEQLHRQVLARQPNHVLALNNLAWSLAARKGKEPATAVEARELIGRALETAGPLPELLDTRAFIALEAGEPRAAVADLEAAIAERPTPGKRFHLARAYLMANQREQAVALWRQAKAAGLRPERLHPLERDAHERAARQLEQ